MLHWKKWKLSLTLLSKHSWQKTNCKNRPEISGLFFAYYLMLGRKAQHQRLIIKEPPFLTVLLILFTLYRVEWLRFFTKSLPSFQFPIPNGRMERLRSLRSRCLFSNDQPLMGGWSGYAPLFCRVVISNNTVECVDINCFNIFHQWVCWVCTCTLVVKCKFYHFVQLSVEVFF